MWSKLTICYESKLDPYILDDVTDDRIKYENIFGIINKTTNLLEHPSKENATISILKIQLGKNDTMFATLTDINEKEWEYVASTKFLISNMFGTKDKEKEKTLQRITEGNEALSLLGLDMDLWNEGSTILDTMEVPESWNSANLTLCYLAKLGENIKNNPKSDFAKSCSNKGPGRHGIEFRVFATRVGFQIFKKEGRYRITYRVDVIIGFNLEEIIATLLSISIGNSENKFAVFIDELNDVVYDYSKAVLATLGEGNIKEILNK
uniref:Uncharacterized protein n=1 Tax=Meloidogyne floridensis TaxID=298350 RepID=A0A915P0K1_9BILA